MKTRLLHNDGGAMVLLEFVVVVWQWFQDAIGMSMVLLTDDD